MSDRYQISLGHVLDRFWMSDATVDKYWMSVPESGYVLDAFPVSRAKLDM